MKTQAWWVCNVCNLKIQKVKSQKGKLEAVSGHRNVCPKATYSIKQIPLQEKA